MSFLPLAGVLIGFLLGRGVAYVERRRRLRAHWAALDVEVTLCEQWARIYLRDEVAAPLYRLSTAVFAASFPVLLAEGAVNGAEVDSLASFNLMVHQINRGMDLATEHRKDPDRLKEEAIRLRLKCTHLLEAHNGNESYVSRARASLREHT